jgi:hypothetical protein
MTASVTATVTSAVTALVTSADTATAAEVGDPGRTRAVYAAILFLVALGVVLIVVAVWLVRNTRVDPVVLGPLERMGERSWRRADPVFQRRQLDEVRPPGAVPLDPTAPPPAADDRFGTGPLVEGFDDLQPGADVVAPPPEEGGEERVATPDRPPVIGR